MNVWTPPQEVINKKGLPRFCPLLRIIHCVILVTVTVAVAVTINASKQCYCHCYCRHHMDTVAVAPLSVSLALPSVTVAITVTLLLLSLSHYRRISLSSSHKHKPLHNTNSLAFGRSRFAPCYDFHTRWRVVSRVRLRSLVLGRLFRKQVRQTMF